MDFLAGKDESAWGEVMKMPKRKISFLWSLVCSPFVYNLYIYVDVWWAKIASTPLMAIY